MSLTPVAPFDAPQLLMVSLPFPEAERAMEKPQISFKAILGRVVRV